jgi:hypothetical protein
MRKPVKLNKSSGSFSVSFDDGYTINKNITISDSKTNISTGFEGGHYIQSPAPDWAQDDPEQLDYIKNKHIAEQYRPITVDGEEFLSEDRNSGTLNIVGEGGIVVETNGNSLHLSVEDYVEGDAIDITDENGKKVISVEPNSIDDTHIESLSINKITQELGETLILYGGGANG